MRVSQLITSEHYPLHRSRLHVACRMCDRPSRDGAGPLDGHHGQVARAGHTCVSTLIASELFFLHPQIFVRGWRVFCNWRSHLCRDLRVMQGEASEGRQNGCGGVERWVACKVSPSASCRRPQVWRVGRGRCGSLWSRAECLSCGRVWSRAAVMSEPCSWRCNGVGDCCR